MDEEEVEAAVRVLRDRSPFRYYGVKLREEVEQFEKEFASQLGLPYAVAVSSGTGALHTALSALGVGPGQEIIVPAYMWVAVASAVVNLGAIPILVDIDDTFGIDPEDLLRRITSRTRGIIAVHMSGAPINLPPLANIARERGLFLLEDCAQANGASIAGQKVGTFGDMAVFSFQMNKNMTSGEGGCVVTRDLQLYRRAVACHDLGYARDEEGRLMFDNPDLCVWGRGYRLDEIRGAVLRVQLRKLPVIIERMRNSKYRIRQALETFSGVRLRRIVDPAGDTGAFLITIYENATIAKQVNRALRAEGITTFPQGMSNIRMTDWGLHLYYNIVSLVSRRSVDNAGFPWNLVENAGSEKRYEKGTCPVADDLFEKSIIMSIPSCLTSEDEADVIQAFTKVMNHEAPGT
ncbi:MAG: DegT/DnrJ/EryC1/StrS aminotransferase [Acidobacteria bacterium]|nr:MAG: DegT/DnrJ/EryC1/StrS aminotransferase [Acidobacteriota bacterium]